MKRKCFECGNYRASIYFDGVSHYCATCLKEKGIRCDVCGGYFPESSIVWLDDQNNTKTMTECIECHG